MYLLDCLGHDSFGALTIGGVSVKKIAEDFGTPVYVMDEKTIRKNCRAYKSAMDECYNNGSLILYASKAFSCKYIYKLVAEEGLGVDVVSGGEMYTALKAGFPADKIYFHGNNKTDDEIKMALDNGIGRIVLDNLTELERINAYAIEKGIKADVLFRIKPGIDAHTHDFIMTGQIDSKFGFALETGEAEEAYSLACKMKGINIVGAHCHIGSQIFDYEPFEHAARVMMTFIAEMKEKFGICMTELNLGGGYGIKYESTDEPIEFGEYIKKISAVVKEIAEKHGIEIPKVLMEPGRSIVAPAGITVYTVGNVKRIPDTRTYVSVDGGMSDNPRYILYGARYEALLVENPDGAPEENVTIAGKCCESGDIIIKDINLPTVKAGDLLAVLATGAYNYSMASNYNRIPRPPVVFVKDGKAFEVVRRESYEDLIRNDR